MLTLSKVSDNDISYNLCWICTYIHTKSHSLDTHIHTDTHTRAHAHKRKYTHAYMNTFTHARAHRHANTLCSITLYLSVPWVIPSDREILVSLELIATVDHVISGLSRDQSVLAVAGTGNRN